MEKVIFIDRDGVINVDPIGDYVKSWEDFRFEEGVVEALSLLVNAGYEIIIISNQAGIGDGVYPEANLWDLQDKMLAALKKEGVKIKATYYCLHGKNEGCSCRKPGVGLFEQAVKNLKIDKSQTYFVGDKASDIQAGKRFGLKTFFVRTGHGKTEEGLLKGDLIPDHRADNLLEAVKVLLS